MSEPVLIGCSHGTRSATGQQTVDALRAAVAAARPELDVRAAHVDVHGPELPDVVAGVVAEGRTGIVVPLLLSTGYHVKVDIAEAIAGTRGAVVAAPTLGPDPVLDRIVVSRLEEALGHPVTELDGEIVLAAAGSSNPRAAADVEAAVRALVELTGAPVRAGYFSAQEPTVADAVAAARARGAARVAVASYLLAPGVFSARLDAAGADAVAAPFGPHPALVELVLQRYDEARAAFLSPVD
ncbi:sirohydrochlorin chelatase [Kineococcus gynurae]|uniref:Sirohydrochlorin chelatase n=1 Tax=Kineococcus gynurae TaxID=452979 RepID=A0ABV5LP16_9ACTN